MFFQFCSGTTKAVMHLFKRFEKPRVVIQSSFFAQLRKQCHSVLLSKLSRWPQLWILYDAGDAGVAGRRRSWPHEGPDGAGAFAAHRRFCPDWTICAPNISTPRPDQPRCLWGQWIRSPGKPRSDRKAKVATWVHFRF